MKARIWTVDGADVAVVEGPKVIISDAQSALDLMATVKYARGCSKAVLDKAIFAEEFFQLRTGLAGEVLQKFTTYRFAVAIYGDFSVYDSKSLKDFIYECNQGRQVFFTSDQQRAIDWLRDLDAR